MTGPLRRLVPAAVATVLGLSLLAGCASSRADDGMAASVSVNGSSGWNGTPVSQGYPLPPDAFTDTAGHRVTLAGEGQGPVTLVFFGYTHCPDICNVVLANIAAALRGSAPAVRRQVRVVFVSTDPARDTRPVVREYLDRFDPAFDGLVAPVATIERVAKSLYISYEKPDGSTGGSYQVNHGTYTTGFLHGRAKVVWSDTTSVADLRADLARLTRLA